MTLSCQCVIWWPPDSCLWFGFSLPTMCLVQSFSASRSQTLLETTRSSGALGYCKGFIEGSKLGSHHYLRYLQCSTGRDQNPLFSTFCAFILWWYTLVGHTLYQNNPPTLGNNHVTFLWRKQQWHQHNLGERFRHRNFLNIWVKVWKCGTVLLLISSICEPTFIK